MTTPTRAVCLNRIGRAHIAPNMSLDRWLAILSSHGVSVKGGAEAWEKVSDETVGAIYAEIREVVEGVG